MRVAGVSRAFAASLQGEFGEFIEAVETFQELQRAGGDLAIGRLEHPWSDQRLISPNGGVPGMVGGVGGCLGGEVARFRKPRRGKILGVPGQCFFFRIVDGNEGVFSLIVGKIRPLFVQKFSRLRRDLHPSDSFLIVFVCF